ncbi:spondin domain-containing protein [Chitinophaga sancti]|uniref:spondin domain-containing protein n=1 Tax=Chitinophaga sancti TaxID=1004 RepID=UPI003F7A2BCD
MYLTTTFKSIALAAILPFSLAACNKDDNNTNSSSQVTLTVENVLQSRPLVESGTFQGSGSPAVIQPGQSTTITFYAAKGEALSFATMYGASNDLFFAPANPGILVYDNMGNPIEGDVSDQVKLWDNGTRVNQKPGAGVTHPGVAESKNITEVTTLDAEGNTYLAASKLVTASLKYNGNSSFTLTLKNTSGGTANETPLSPGVWSISYIAGGNLLAPNPLYQSGKPTANGLTDIAEAGNNSTLATYIQSITGIFTPLSPILVVIYNGIDNPIYKTGQVDAGKGLMLLAQKGNADTLAAYLRTVKGVKAAYVLPAPSTTVLLPQISGAKGGMVSMQIDVTTGDRLAIATMYGFSNDWFFASAGNGVDAMQKGDISNTLQLFDDGTAVNQFPGAGVTQVNLAGTPLKESLPITAVPNPNAFTTLPDIAGIIKVNLQ